MLPTPQVVGADYERVYDPAEDSFLLLDAFEQEKPRLEAKSFAHRLPLVVEIGTGTGIVSTFLNANKVIPRAYYIATDINPYSCATALKTNAANATTHNFETVRCDLTTALRLGQIDLLVFNPPYVPTEDVPEMPKTAEEEDVWVDIALNGGPEGMDVTNRVLDSLDTVLAIGGEAFILFCARNKPESIAQRYKQLHSNFDVERVIFRKAGWEELCIYRFTRLH